MKRKRCGTSLASECLFNHPYVIVSEALACHLVRSLVYSLLLSISVQLLLLDYCVVLHVEGMTLDGGTTTVVAGFCAESTIPAPIQPSSPLGRTLCAWLYSQLHRRPQIHLGAGTH